LDLVSGLAERVGALTLQLPNGAVRPLGSCFFIGNIDQFAVAVTAAHCLDFAEEQDYATRVSSAPGSPFQVERTERIWNRISIATSVKHRDTLFMSLPLDAEEALSSRSSDAAVLLMSTEYDGLLADRHLEILKGAPVKGESVIVAGFWDTTVSTSDAVLEDGRALFTSVHATFQVVTANVVEVFPTGVRDIGWPCFQLDTPFFSGMSGGCVLVEREGRLVAAGIICRDEKTEVQFASARAAIATTAWPGLDPDGAFWRIQKRDAPPLAAESKLYDFLRQIR